MKLKKLKLWHKVIVGLALGVLIGLYIPGYAVKLQFVGDVFMKAIKIVVGPLVFFSLVMGVTSATDTESLGRVGMKAIVAFLVTTTFAVIFGLATGIIFEPGKNVSLVTDSQNILIDSASCPTAANKKFCIIQFLSDIVPASLTQAMLEGNVLQIVFVAIFTGIAINKLSKDPKIQREIRKVKDFFIAGNRVLMRMISIVVEFSPYAACALIATMVGEKGLDPLIGVSKLMFAVCIAMILQYIVFGLMIKYIAKLSPFPFYRKSLEYQAVAFATSSSKASLGKTMEVCREKLGISEPSTSFLLPLGTSINMDGLAINLGITAIFFAQSFGIVLTFSDYMIIILTATLGSMGGAGIPSASLIMTPLVLSSANIPLDGIAILFGIDRILDMMRTVINITGDATITLLIDSSENTLDVEKYYEESKDD